MSKNYDDFQKTFRLPELVIYETQFWRWSIRPEQATIGSGVLSAKRPVEAFSDITEEESADLGKMVKVIESTLKKTFNYQRINYLMLMMADYHVHFHVIPRYDHEIDFSGIVWKDQKWPTPLELDVDPISDSVLFAIRDIIKKNV